MNDFHSYELSAKCAEAVSTSDLRSTIIRMSVCKCIRPDFELRNLRFVRQRFTETCPGLLRRRAWQYLR